MEGVYAANAGATAGLAIARLCNEAIRKKMQARCGL